MNRNRNVMKIALQDVYNDWRENGAIFTQMERLFDLPWKDHISGMELDYEYFGNHSGSKQISPLLEKLVTQDGLSEQAMEVVAGLIFHRNILNWDGKWKTMFLEYNPISNYDRHQTQTTKTKRTGASTLNDVEDRTGNTTTGETSETAYGHVLSHDGSTTSGGTSKLETSQTGTSTATGTGTETNAQSGSDTVAGTASQTGSTTDTKTGTETLAGTEAGTSKNTNTKNGTISVADGGDEVATTTYNLSNTGTKNDTGSNSSNGTTTHKRAGLGSDGAFTNEWQETNTNSASSENASNTSDTKTGTEELSTYFGKTQTTKDNTTITDEGSTSGTKNDTTTYNTKNVSEVTNSDENSNTTTYGKTDTRTRDLTDTQNTTTSGTNTTTNDLTGTDVFTDTNSGKDTGKRDQTTSETGNTTRTQTGSTSDDEEVVFEDVTSGNIGVTTSQQMLMSEREVWDWNFFNGVFDDVDKVLTIGSFVECDEYDDVISSLPLRLPIASETTLGGIKVGENLTIEADGTLNAQGGDGKVRSVNGKEGDVTLTAKDVGALPDSTIYVGAVNNKTGNVTLTNDDVGAPSLEEFQQIEDDVETNTRDITSIKEKYVTSVNGETGDVTTPEPPVTSVNGQTGAVTVDVPVTSVNGETGDVIVDAPTKEQFNELETDVMQNTGDIAMLSGWRVVFDEVATMQNLTTQYIHLGKLKQSTEYILLLSGISSSETGITDNYNIQALHDNTIDYFVGGTFVFASYGNTSSSIDKYFSYVRFMRFNQGNTRCSTALSGSRNINNSNPTTLSQTVYGKEALNDIGDNYDVVFHLNNSGPTYCTSIHYILLERGSL